MSKELNSPSRSPIITPPAKNDDLGWAVAALELVINGLKSEGYKLTDEPTTSYTPLWNARAAKVSIEEEIRYRSSETARPDFPYALPSTEEVERTMKDAARYRWLRNHPIGQFTPNEEKGTWWPSVWMCEDATHPLQAFFLDDAVDAAIVHSSRERPRE